MRHPTWAVVASVVFAASCGGYWRGRPAGDTAPASWADPGSVPAPTGSLPARASTLEERLHNLDRLRSDGLIGQAEYRERRQQALDDAYD